MASPALPISAPVDPALLGRREDPRWPWVKALLLLAVAWTVPTLVAAAQLLSIWPNGRTSYTAWVYAPEAKGFLAAVVFALLGLIPMALPGRLRRFRIVVLSVVIAAGVVAAALGVHESVARRHLGAALDKNIAAVTVVGAVPLGPVLHTDPGSFYPEGPGVPVRSRAWAVAGHSRQAACAAVTRTAASAGSWAAGEDCAFVGSRGRVTVWLAPEVDRSGRWYVDVEAVPAG